MDWIQASIYTTNEGLEPVCGKLYQLGITGLEIEDETDFRDFIEKNTQYWDYVDDELIKQKEEKETCVKVYVSDNAPGREMLISIKNAMEELKQLQASQSVSLGSDAESVPDFGRLSIELFNVNEEDWANNWKKYFKPIAIGDKIIVKPSWENLADSAEIFGHSTQADKLILEIDPGMVFGTGTHETTQLCIKLLEKYADKKTFHVLDIGCGSGILSIASILLGADHAVGIDIDPNAADVAMTNAALNNIGSDQYNVFSGNILEDAKNISLSGGKKYDIIVANIVADVIIALLEIIPGFLSEDGIFIASGIVDIREKDVQNAFENLHFEIIDKMSDNGWLAFSARLKK